MLSSDSKADVSSVNNASSVHSDDSAACNAMANAWICDSLSITFYHTIICPFVNVFVPFTGFGDGHTFNFWRWKAL